MGVGTPESPVDPAFTGGLPVNCQYIPRLLREAPHEAGRRIADHEAQDEERRQRYPALICRACGHTVTFENKRIEVGGSHRHTFFNPAGIVFDLGCFSEAQGCSTLGEASDEFSWFPGYVWKVALCSSCTTHLGWQFLSGDVVFYGLILTNLARGG